MRLSGAALPGLDELRYHANTSLTRMTAVLTMISGPATADCLLPSFSYIDTSTDNIQHVEMLDSETQKFSIHLRNFAACKNPII